MTKRIRSLSLASLLVVCSIAMAENWPRFRGPDGTGVADKQDIPVTWTGKNIKWKVAIPGGGNSSPIVWQKSLFLQTSLPTERVLLCIDAASGKTLWKQSIPAVKPERLHQKNTPASSTPATDGERVAVAFWDGRNIIFHVYDFQGKLLWKRDLGPFISQHGAGASPIFFEDKIFYANDQDDYSVLYAFDKNTGKIVWRRQRPSYRACYSAPYLIDRGSGPELIITSTMNIESYDPSSGETNWSWKWKHHTKRLLRTTGSSLYTNGIIFASGGDGGGDRHGVAVKLSGSGKETQPELLWETKKDCYYVPSPVARGDYVYIVHDKGFAGCYNVLNGKLMYYKRIPGAAFTASLVLVDGNVFAASENGDVYVFAADPKYKLIAQNSLGERIRATPAVADGRLYVRGQQHLFCISK